MKKNGVMQRLFSTILVPLPVRLVTVSLLMNVAVETSGVFMPLYASTVGSSNFQVGLIAAAYGLAFFFSSIIFGRQSDLHGRLRFIRLGLGLTSVAYLSQIAASNPVELLAARGVVGFSMGITSAAVIAYTYENQKQIGTFVSYGALGWLVGALIAAVVRDFASLFMVSSVAAMLAFLASLTLRQEPARCYRVAALPLPLFRANRKVYFAFFLRQIGANAVWAIFPLYLTGIGASKMWIAVLDAVNNGGQFVAMRFVERFNPARVFRAGLLVSALVFAVYGLATDYRQLWPVQILLAIAWSAMFIGALGYLLRKNIECGTVSGLLYSTVYLSAGLGPFMGGAVAHAWGFVTLMYASSGMSLLGFLSSRGLKTGKETPASEPAAISGRGRSLSSGR